jgi:hypothetical protein
LDEQGSSGEVVGGRSLWLVNAQSSSVQADAGRYQSLQAAGRAGPNGNRLAEALRPLPDLLRLLRRLAADSDVSRTVRVRLWLLAGYLAIPFDLVPDFVPCSATPTTPSSSAWWCARSSDARALP